MLHEIIDNGSDRKPDMLAVARQFLNFNEIYDPVVTLHFRDGSSIMANDISDNLAVMLARGSNEATAHHFDRDFLVRIAYKAPVITPKTDPKSCIDEFVRYARDTKSPTKIDPTDFMHKLVLCATIDPSRDARTRSKGLFYHHALMLFERVRNALLLITPDDIRRIIIHGLETYRHEVGSDVASKCIDLVRARTDDELVDCVERLFQNFGNALTRGSADVPDIEEMAASSPIYARSYVAYLMRNETLERQD